MSAGSFHEPGSRRRWQLTSGALERLLVRLDPDRERAAEIYEKLRERTIGLLQWWGALRADELADEALDRVARKIEEGTVIPEGSIAAYLRGVARMVFYESTREPSEPLTGGEVLVAPESEDTEGALTCLDRCLASLDHADRKLVLKYYDSGKKAEVRQRLAGEMGISMTALRIRTHRLRERLEQCVTGCLERR